MDHSPDGSETTISYPQRLVTLKPLYHLDFSAAPSAAPSPIKPVLLNEILDVSTQQALIIKDLLFALLGYEGHYVRYSERFQASLVLNRIRGPDFRVAAPLDISLKAVAKKLLRYGKYYLGLRAFAQIYDMQHFGRVNQRLCREIARCLAHFRQLVLSFEDAFYLNPHLSLSAMDNEIHSSCADALKHLYEIACAVHTETEARNPRFKTATDPRFDTFLSLIRSDINLGTSVSSDPNAFDVCKGGLVLKIVESRSVLYEGDMKACAFLSVLFEAISVDYVSLLNTWLAEGELSDLFLEFLVKKNDLPKNIFYSNVERYWEELYVIKVDGLIGQFLDREVQAKVLATGKFLNIFKRCIGSASLQDFPDDISNVACPEKITSLCAQDLNLKIVQFYDRANNLLLKLLFRGYHFSDMLSCLHETYLLCESSKTDTFLDKAIHDLSRNKRKVSTVTLIDTFNGVFSLGDPKQRHSKINQGPMTTRSSISSLLRTFQNFSIDSNNFYDLSEEIISIRSFDAADAVTGDEQASSAIKKLVSQSLRQQTIALASEQSSGDEPDKSSVIAAVNIDCELPFPINLMISENLIFEFQLIFKLQMIIRYASKLIDSSWRDVMYSTVWNYKHFSEPLRKLILRSRVLIFRMKSFVTELQNYVDHFVIEASFGELKATVNQYTASLEKPRPASRAPRSSSPFKDGGQPLTKHANKNNSIFDEKIKITLNQQASGGKFGPDAPHVDVHGLNQSIGTYLSNILRDSMITNSQLLGHIRVSLGLVTEFTGITSRLKKTFILTDAALLEAFARDYPGRFDNVEFNEEAVKNRIAGLNNVITKFWMEFNLSLQQFTQDLRSASTENASFGTLKDKLAVL
ncbi:hypothetical protein METBIDRAFT_42598 [Metschnikowia bicuspidata var. bicuspidata NRRL YB-4993]|uniref:Spindle pole body component n=1 Tax=Metschnikowia bicuspidata var. bicuspidata NRRL YB-4993 TaxID=869754 RepID=A0A1A0HBX8_9ASCO|nr:hypothetical protein METBIDRAFT_42598 [Metschnikowia bicuspidata var. bicuspidata NRRL YB-4993]OBA21516.1 hypothetical protein METBIDRAFT_42598 [Metschnikowia bicuspidata var. bicuspidata NRRL YB-4993]